MIFATLNNFRPDLLELQLSLVARFLPSAEIIVGIPSDNPETLAALYAVCSTFKATAIDLPAIADEMEYRSSLQAFLSHLPSGDLLYAESDCFPTAMVTGIPMGFASRGRGWRTLMSFSDGTDRRFDRKPDHRLPSLRAKKGSELPPSIQSLAAQYEGMQSCEVVGDWFHLDKCSGTFPQKHHTPKWEFAQSLARLLGGSLPEKCWSRISAEPTAEQAERHRAAVEKSKGIKGILHGAAKAAQATLRIGEALPATIEQRRGICGGCDQLVNGRCLLCKCFYALKVRIADEKCPLDKW